MFLSDGCVSCNLLRSWASNESMGFFCPLCIRHYLCASIQHKKTRSLLPRRQFWRKATTPAKRQMVMFGPVCVWSAQTHPNPCWTGSHCDSCLRCSGSAAWLYWWDKPDGAFQWWHVVFGPSTATRWPFPHTTPKLDFSTDEAKRPLIQSQELRSAHNQYQLWRYDRRWKPDVMTGAATNNYFHRWLRKKMHHKFPEHRETRAKCRGLFTVRSSVDSRLTSLVE